MPLEITAPNNSSDAFTAEMIFSRQLLGNDKEAPLYYLSEFNYWHLTRNTGTSKVRVSLYWDERYSPIIDTSRLRIGQWEVDEWADLGHGTITGNYSAGKIKSIDSLNTFGSFLNTRGLGFIQNKGQVVGSDTNVVSNVSFYTKAMGLNHYFKNDTIVHVFSTNHLRPDTFPDSLFRVDMILCKGAMTPRTAVGINQNPGYLNYHLGYLTDSIINVPHFERIKYDSAFANIDLVVSQENDFEMRFVVRSEGTPSSIKFKYSGATEVVIDDDHLVIKTPLGDLIYSPIEAYYDSSNVRIRVVAGYRVNSGDTISLDAGSYNPSYNLVFIIRPPVPVFPNNAFGNMYWSTFVEQNVNISDVYYKNSDNTIYSIASSNTNAIFPGTSGTINSNPFMSSLDVLIVKFKANRGVDWFTYYGGSGSEFENSIWVDPSGNIIFSGNTSSADYPQEPCGGCYSQSKIGTPIELFVTKLSSDGTQELFSSYFGGSGDEELHSITGDLNGNYYLGGVDFNSTGFPYDFAAGAFNKTYAGGDNDPFIAKFNTGNDLIWCTSVGGDNEPFGAINEEVTGMCVDNAGNLYVTGTTGSAGGNSFLSSPCTSQVDLYEFPLVDPGGPAYVENTHGNTDAYFIKFDTQNRIIWSTMYGGSGIELLFDPAHNNNGIAVDASGNIYSIGTSFSSAIDDHISSATTGSYYQETNLSGTADLYIVKFTNQFELVYSTFYGGNGDDFGRGIALDGSGNIYMTGLTVSNTFPLKAPNASSPGGLLHYQDTYNGGTSDAFLIKMTSTLKHTLGTYIGGSGVDEGQVVTANAAGNNVIVAGISASNAIITGFPVADPNGSLDYFKGVSPGFNGGFISNLVNVCTGCRIQNEETIDIQSSNDILIYPNPANKEVFYEMSNSASLKTISIFSTLGNLELRIEGDKLSEQKILINNLESGIYFIKFDTYNGVITKKLIIYH